jgi:hypothetical protein
MKTIYSTVCWISNFFCYTYTIVLYFFSRYTIVQPILAVSPYYYSSFFAGNEDIRPTVVHFFCFALLCFALFSFAQRPMAFLTSPTIVATAPLGLKAYKGNDPGAGILGS